MSHCAKQQPILMLAVLKPGENVPWLGSLERTACQSLGIACADAPMQPLPPITSSFQLPK